MLAAAPARARRAASRASKNALRHGLAADALADPRLAEKIRLLALAIAGEGAHPSTSKQAATIAQAQVDEGERHRLAVQADQIQALMDRQGLVVYVYGVLTLTSGQFERHIDWRGRHSALWRTA